MKKSTYGVSQNQGAKPTAAAALPYLPPQPRRYHPNIGLVGCGGISACHLKNYRDMGLNVVALCDLDLERAKTRAREYFPQAAIVADYRELVCLKGLEVVDVATHPAERVPIMEAALKAGRHVLSQKPFALDITTAQRLTDLAAKQGVKLAVNQNGRWAPHWSYLRQLIQKGTLGTLRSLDFTVSWDHAWVKTTPFNSIHHLVLYDFAVHWFDIASVFLDGRKAKSVFATVTAGTAQPFDPPALAAVIADYGDAQARWSFNGANAFAQCDRTLICGSEGTALSRGPTSSQQTVTYTTARGAASPPLEGSWFVNGFQGTMGELLCAIEQKREPSHSAANNLTTLELAFAALASAASGRPVAPGATRRLSGDLLRQCRPAAA